MALAVCVSVLYPSAAKADPIKVQAGVVIAALDAKITANTNTSDPNSPVATASVGADATFLSRGGLEQSAYFANHGSTYLFADDRSSFHDAISAEGLGVNLDTHITIALRAGEQVSEGKVYLGGEVCVMHVPEPDSSMTPEPASLLLIGTGVVGLFLYRRQLFV
ncbi:MAG TPA: PEP-CTERM sorting domain-containing protein [Chloroflexota bacterium]|nr:PEP-CTERM sorting domain-containing protein [Chloroflexota bacterium]